MGEGGRRETGDKIMVMQTVHCRRREKKEGEGRREKDGEGSKETREGRCRLKKEGEAKREKGERKIEKGDAR
jgi:hypothetical protein